MVIIQPQSKLKETAPFMGAVVDNIAKAACDDQKVGLNSLQVFCKPIQIGVERGIERFFKPDNVNKICQESFPIPGLTIFCNVAADTVTLPNVDCISTKVMIDVCKRMGDNGGICEIASNFKDYYQEKCAGMPGDMEELIMSFGTNIITDILNEKITKNIGASADSPVTKYVKMFSETVSGFGPYVDYAKRMYQQYRNASNNKFSVDNLTKFTPQDESAEVKVDVNSKFKLEVSNNSFEISVNGLGEENVTGETSADKKLQFKVTPPQGFFKNLSCSGETKNPIKIKTNKKEIYNTASDGEISLTKEGLARFKFTLSYADIRGDLDGNSLDIYAFPGEANFALACHEIENY